MEILRFFLLHGIADYLILGLTFQSVDISHTGRTSNFVTSQLNIYFFVYEAKLFSCVCFIKLFICNLLM